MSKNNEKHEPVLLSEENAVRKKPKVRRRTDEPVLFSEDHRIGKVKPPYLLIFFILFALLSVFWKMFFYGDKIVDPRVIKEQSLHKIKSEN